MLVAWLLLFVASAVVGDFVIIEEKSSQKPEVVHKEWHWTGGGRKGTFVVQVDSYRTHSQKRYESTVDAERMATWILGQLGNLAADEGQPVHLDVSLVEQTITTSGHSKDTSKNVDHRGRRSGCLIILLLVCCALSWTLFFLQVNRLIKRFRKSFRKGTKKQKAAKKAGSDLKVPLLEPEGALK